MRHAERQFLDPGLGATAVGTGELVEIARLGIAFRISEPGERMEEIGGKYPPKLLNFLLGEPSPGVSQLIQTLLSATGLEPKLFGPLSIQVVIQRFPRNPSMSRAQRVLLPRRCGPAGSMT